MYGSCRICREAELEEELNKRRQNNRNKQVVKVFQRKHLDKHAGKTADKTSGRIACYKACQQKDYAETRQAADNRFSACKRNFHVAEHFAEKTCNAVACGKPDYADSCSSFIEEKR